MTTAAMDTPAPATGLRRGAAIWVGAALSLMTLVYYAVVATGVALQLAFLTFVAATWLLLRPAVPPGTLRLALPIVAVHVTIQLASLLANIGSYTLASALVALVDTGNVALSLVAGIVIARAAGTADTRRIFATCAVLVGGLLAGALLVHWTERYGGRFIGHGLQPNWWGGVAYGAVCCAIFVRRWQLRWAVILLSLLMCLEASSRASIVGIGVVVGLLALSEFRPTARKLIVLCLAVIPGMCLGWLLAGGAITDFVLNTVLQVDNVYRGLDTGFTGRTVGWAYAIDMFLRWPLFGVGPNNLPEVHNGYLMALGEAGVPGGLFFAIVLLLPVFVRGVRREAVIVVLSYAVFVCFAPRSFNLVLGSFIPTLLAMQGYVALVARREGVPLLEART